MSNVYIIGYRGTGKTTVSELLAKEANMKVSHMDLELEKRLGPIKKFIEKNGWNKFRNEETKLLEELSKKSNMIIDCGGGIIEKNENISLMKKTGRCIWLKTSPEILKKRLKKDKEKRPSLTGKSSVDEIKEVLAKRIPLYNKAADFELDTENKKPKKIAEEIKYLLKETKISASIIEDNLSDALKSINKVKDSDLIEVRLDYFSKITEDMIKKLLENKKKEIIITCRPKKQGGKFLGTENERILILKKAIEYGADFIDIEFESGNSITTDLIKNKKSAKIIISRHDFSKTPKLNELEKLYKNINSLNPDLIKIVTFANSINDCFEIFRFLKNKRNLISFCMGQKGQVTRILAPKFGSVFTYASIEKGKESAIGQLTADELINEYNFYSINKNTKLLGVIGEYAENSKSRFMHNSNFSKNRLNYIYVPLKVAPVELKEFMKKFSEFDFIGAAVTVPHKESIVNFIDNLDDTAKKIGATNTLVNENGRLIGYNTDYFGAVEALKEKASLINKKILVIGAGGAARAIIYGLKKEKANIIVINRTIEKAEELANDFDIDFTDIKNMDIEAEKSDIIINTTSVGMNPRPDECILKHLPKNKIVMDIVYSPIETKLIKLARKNKCITITGERMLIYQAIGQFEKWTGIKPKFKDMEKALLENINTK